MTWRYFNSKKKEKRHAYSKLCLGFSLASYKHFPYLFQVGIWFNQPNTSITSTRAGEILHSTSRWLSSRVFMVFVIIKLESFHLLQSQECEWNSGFECAHTKERMNTIYKEMQRCEEQQSFQFFFVAARKLYPMKSLLFNDNLIRIGERTSLGFTWLAQLSLPFSSGSLWMCPFKWI